MRKSIGVFVAFALAIAALLPSASRAQFADQATYAGTASGSTNAYLITVPNATQYSDLLGVLIKWYPNAANTGSATLQVAGNGGNLSGTAPTLYKASNNGPVVLVGGELQTTQAVVVMLDASNHFEIISGLNGTVSQALPPPQGYLTPCSYSVSVTGCTTGQMLPTGDVSADATVYYGTWFGNQIPLYDGTVWHLVTFTELSLTLPSSFSSGTIRDACVYYNAGSPVLVGSQAWSTSTAGSGSRGSGTGTAQIGLFGGIWTNSVAITGTNGSSTYSIPANQCTIVGSLLFSANGQITWNVTYGQSRQIGVANLYNRQPITLKAGDSTASWTDASTTYAPAHASSANSLTVLFSEPAKVSFSYQQNFINNSASNTTEQTAIGYNSTSSASGTTGVFGNNPTANFDFQGNTLARYSTTAGIGQQTATALTKYTTNAVSGFFLGTEANMVLQAETQQ